VPVWRHSVRVKGRAHATAALTAIAALLAAAQVVGATPGLARDRLALPFTCALENGRLRVEPAAEQTYVITGGREQKAFTHCPGNETGQCKTWTLHRFALQCVGGRAMWPEIVAAAAAHGDQGRVAMESGQLLLRLGPRRIGSRDPSCTDPQRVASRTYIKWEQCQLANQPMPRGGFKSHVLAFPRGFAPLGLIGARVLSETEPGARASIVERATLTEVPPVVVEPAVVMPAAASPAEATPVFPEVPEADLMRGVILPAAAAPSVTTPQALPRRIPEEVVAEALAPPELPPASQTHAAVAISPPPVAVRTGWTSRVEAAAVVVARDEAAPGRPAMNMQFQFGVALLLATWLVIAAGLTWSRRRPKVVWRQVDLGAATTSDGDGSRAIALRSKAEGHIMLITRSLDQLVAVAPLRNALARDLQASERRLAVVIAATATAIDAKPEDWSRARRRLERIAHDLERLRQIADGAVSSLSGLSAARSLPRNRDEAYAALGVTHGVSETILKKLVDALRVSWHPDLATSEADRKARDVRIKEINVAWDLITGKRGAE
jgi:hypothetical protein